MITQTTSRRTHTHTQTHTEEVKPTGSEGVQRRRGGRGVSALLGNVKWDDWMATGMSVRLRGLSVSLNGAQVDDEGRRLDEDAGGMLQPIRSAP